MSNHDQCPSTLKGEKKRPGKAELAAVARSAGTVNGMNVWRSPEEMTDAPQFRDWLEREFPAGASELERRDTGESRRDFLKIMGASIALAGAATIPGCRRPEHKILPYSREVPEEIIPGKPLFYATSFPRPDGGAEGLLIETHEGRPTKIEGNPIHPTNRGRCTTWALASILGLYDPERPKDPIYNNPVKGKVTASWADFRTWASTHFGKYSENGGEGLAFLVSKQAGIARDAARDAIKRQWPNARWVPYRGFDNESAAAGLAMAFGRPVREVFNFGKDTTRVVVSLDRDFLSHEPGEVINARGFSASRQVITTSDPMSRLYVIETGFGVTGAQADHRLRLSPSRVTAFAVGLAKFILPKLGDANGATLAAAIDAVGGDDAGIDRGFLEECAKDLLLPENRGKSVICVGQSQPAAVHALAAAMNAALGNIGNSVFYTDLPADEAVSSRDGIRQLAADMDAGRVTTLVVAGVNPVFDAPADVNFLEAYGKVAATICLNANLTETAAISTWSLPGAHYLESWGDARSVDGTLSPVQPMIAPLYAGAMSEIELLAAIRQFAQPESRVDGFELVLDAWRAGVASGAIPGSSNFDKFWRRALHDGFVAGTTIAPSAGRTGVRFDEVARAAASLAISAAPSADKLDLVFRIGHIGDGGMANYPWLQELPEAGTRTVWDNPILLSPKTAKALGVTPEGYSDKKPEGVYTDPTYPTARMAEIRVGERLVKGPVWILPGMADDTAILTVGYGRRNGGVVCDGVGFDVYPLLTSDMAAASAAGATLAKAAGTYMIASTQNHWTMDNRESIVRAVDLAVWKKYGDEIVPGGPSLYQEPEMLKLGERLGELAHTPPNDSIYKNPYNKSIREAEPESVFAKGPQWAMTIDQQVCTGCGACTIACQSENNIPVVGKIETAKGREMTWIRVDRYFTGDDINEPAAMLHQPVACVHCENAPCETVCPVNATVHGPEGLNYMTYNRCIGTRYCANNCPYKVRRYNFFDYGVTKFNGPYYGKDIIEAVTPARGGITGSSTHNEVNPNLIPPRLRAKLEEITRMRKNPDVTVRSRGVMEKCSYCVQRINAAKIETKLSKLDHIPDGYFESACQQACPSNAITFGDMLDPSSKVTAMRDHARSYLLLGYLNTRPRTSHMVRVMNPNPALLNLTAAGKARVESWAHPFHGGGHGGHEGDAHDRTGGGHAFRIDNTKKAQDKGYAMSLTVLGGGSMA